MPQEWSYRRLAEAYREEKGSNALTALPPDFDQSLIALLCALELAAKSGSADAGKELENARRQALGLLRLRRTKIVMRALLIEGSLQANQEPAGMTDGEHALYDRVHGLSEKEEERLAGLLLPKANSNPGGAGAAAQNQSAFSPSLVRVQLLKDVPAYRGADGQAYGPFTTGQQVELPEGEATWMTKGGMAAYTAIGAGGTSEVEVRPNGQKVMYVTKAVKFKKMHIDMDVPEYTNPEGRTYGPFSKGEVVELPEDEARFLIRGKLGIETD
ncbi:MAG: hypothetical protein KGH63_01320 [Candidatus Micrarchaeota archaeon]|nr:hypothetical protein [Candidatus Micrarchaeota archaeon]